MDLMAIKCEPTANEVSPGADPSPAGETTNTEQPPFAAVLGEQVKQLLDLLTAGPVPEPAATAGKSEEPEPELEPEKGEAQAVLACVLDLQAPAGSLPVAPKAEPAPVPVQQVQLCQANLPAPEAKTLPEALAPTAAKRHPGLDSFADGFPEGWEKLFAAETETIAGGLKSETPPVLEKTAMPATRTAEAQPQAGLEPTGDLEQGWVPETKKSVAPAVSAIRAPSAESADINGSSAEAVQGVKPASILQEEGRAEGGNSRFDWRPELTHEEASPAAVAVPVKLQAQTGTAATPAQVLNRMSEVEKQNVVEHFVRAGVPAISRGGEDAVWVELYPPELGKVRVWVENSGNQVNAVVTVQDTGIRDLFQEQLGALRRGLEEAGLKLGELSVEIRQDGKPEERQPAEAQTGKRSLGSWGGKPWAPPLPKNWSRTWPQEAAGRVDLMV